jgi:membrane dipeptidase
MMRLLLLFLSLQVTHAWAQQASLPFSDLHNSVLYRVFKQKDVHSFADTSARISIQKIEEANSQLVILSIGIPRYGNHGPGYTSIEEVFQFLKSFRRHCETEFPHLAFVENKTDLLAAQKNRKIALAYALEGSHLLEGKEQYLDSLRKVGVVMLGLAHWYCNDFILSPNEKAQQLGIAQIDGQSRLSKKGKLLLKRMIQLEMFIDVSHMPPLLFQQVAKINRGRSKLIASHANAYAVYPHPRNLTDRQLRAIARSGGRVGICLHNPILSEEPASLKTVVRHIQHISSIIGVKSVCLGTDYEGNTSPPQELSQLHQIPELAKQLRAEGFSKQEIRQLLSENVLSIWDD